MRWLFITGDNPYEGQTGYYKASRDYIDVILSDPQSHVRILTLDGRRKEPDDATRVTIKAINGSRRIPKRILQAVSLFSTASANVWQFKPGVVESALLDTIDQWNPDIVVFNGIRAGWLLARYSGKSLPRKLYIAHNPETKSLESSAEYEHRWLLRIAIQLEARKMGLMERRILERADGVIVQTEEDAGRLEELCRPLPQFLVMPPRLPVPPLQGDNLPGSVPSILLVGSFRWLPKRRDAEWLIEQVFPLIQRNVPEVRLSIVGSGADILRSYLKPGLEVFSDVPDVEPYFKGKPVFIVVDRQLGGIKNKTVEAASHGLAIVTTKGGSEGTGLVDGESCAIADNVEEFASQVIGFLRDEDKRCEFGRKAYEAVVNRFDRESNAARFRSFAAMLLNDSVYTPEH